MQPSSFAVTNAFGLRVAIGIATRGRPDVLAQVLADLPLQSVQPDRILICATEAADVGDVSAFPSVEKLFAASGLPRQRNAILDAIDDCDVVLFLDDDFLMDPHYIAATLDALHQDPELVVTTGLLYADGVKGPGLSPAAGRQILAEHMTARYAPGVEAAQHGYGCNMALRLAPVQAHGLRFDERLPLYGWSEDVDFTHRLGRYGRLAKVLGAQGVHLGVKSGRTPGHKLGYSQVANPLYLFGKGSYSLSRALRSVGRNMAANAARAFRPEPFIDRRGRLRGNAIALADLMRGRMRPERILDL
jgi:GT2 family glycosyltransferase